MINSVDNSIINMVLNNAKTQESQKTQETNVIKAEDTALKSDQTSEQNTDTLELSAEAQSYLDTISDETENSTETSVIETSTNDSTLDELYTYTESELKKLLALGEITQSEYDEEMASRSITTS